MEATKKAASAAKEFLSRDQQHNTEVRETFNPAITKETYKPIEREEETIAIDREQHQAHHQTRIQPIEDHITTPEHHEQRVLPVEERQVKLGDDREVERKLAAERQQFKSTSQTLPTTHTTTSAGTIQGSHIHHHVHEQIQPVIEREIIQPSIIHTTKPVHEVVEHEATIHPPTVQPKMTLEEFRRAGGTLEGREDTTTQVFEGEPQVRENGGAQQKHPFVRKGGKQTVEMSQSARERERQERERLGNVRTVTPPMKA
ncbi:hypothetical protein EX30DRAFT_335925 [Ascodesmis nigricans]|uniref:Allergen n=1 Tax=Ascodesmis nigricans TaxID=341454 RepID=A0A4S2MJB1_9PEZI|nr:hypothetical protein EX30DRAFT_335925 [Ascodesmis nigricans]